MYCHLSQYWTLLFLAALNNCTELRKYAFSNPCLLDFFPRFGGFYDLSKYSVDHGGPVVIILATGSEVRGLKPGRGCRIFSERKNPDYDFLRKGNEAMGPVS